MARCNSCHAEAWWAVTTNGKPMLVDQHPVEGGNLVISARTAKGVEVRVLRKGEDPGEEPTYRSHFASCPNAREHRRR